ncbi:MAG: glutaminyl-peptide cyclotransferase [Planctomycetota bacterium]
MFSASKARWFYFPMLSAVLFVLILVLSNEFLLSEQRETTPILQVRVLQVFPHDAGAFCQGLEVEGETLYEGTGQYGNSSLRKVELKTGKVQSNQPLHQNYFGEGITILGKRIYQLTWKENTCVVYEKETLKALGVYKYSGQGWGLANDGKLLYMSDGTNTLRVVDPRNFKVLKRLRVKDGRRSIDNLNELEFIDGFLYANIWYEDYIAKIDPKTGKIVAWVDCTGVYPANTRPDREHVLNGIAWDKDSGRIFVTGKNWPRLYEIEILDPAKDK